MKDSIKEAIKTLKDEGFIVIKPTQTMLIDMDECEKLNSTDEVKDCWGCSCNICLMQKY